MNIILFTMLTLGALYIPLVQPMTRSGTHYGIDHTWLDPRKRTRSGVCYDHRTSKRRKKISIHPAFNPKQTIAPAILEKNPATESIRPVPPLDMQQTVSRAKTRSCSTASTQYLSSPTYCDYRKDIARGQNLLKDPDILDLYLTYISGIYDQEDAADTRINKVKDLYIHAIELINDLNDSPEQKRKLKTQANAVLEKAYNARAQVFNQNKLSINKALYRLPRNIPLHDPSTVPLTIS